MRVAGGPHRAWNATVSGSSCVRRWSSPASGPRRRRTRLGGDHESVFMCAPGRADCAMPRYESRARSAGRRRARDLRAEFRRDSPSTVGNARPTFSNTRPCIHCLDAAAGRLGRMVGALPRRAHERPPRARPRRARGSGLPVPRTPRRCRRAVARTARARIVGRRSWDGSSTAARQRASASSPRSRNCAPARPRSSSAEAVTAGFAERGALGEPSNAAMRIRAACPDRCSTAQFFHAMPGVASQAGT